MIFNVQFRVFITVVLIVLSLLNLQGQKLGEKYIIFRPSSTVADARFSYIKALKKGLNTKTQKLSWDTYTEVNVVHIEDIINYEFEIIKVNKNGTTIIALHKPRVVGGKEVIHEPRYLLKDFKEALRTKEIITRSEFEKFISTKFPNEKDRLLNRESWVGMTEEQVYISNGKPSKISVYKNNKGIKKQYDYPLLKKKIIVEQGKVTSIRPFYY